MYTTKSPRSGAKVERSKPISPMKLQAGGAGRKIEWKCSSVQAKPRIWMARVK
jgi:hypothetical protein